MKYYDKNLSKINTNIKSILLVLVVFVLGFIAGYVVGGGSLTENENPANNTIQERRVE